jgi:hypothetical protein
VAEYCDSSKAYSWCSDATQFIRADVAVGWVSATKEPGVNERCLVLQMKAEQYGLDFSQCSAQNSVLCEVSLLCKNIDIANLLNATGVP